MNQLDYRIKVRRDMIANHELQIKSLRAQIAELEKKRESTYAHLTLCSYCGSVNEIVNQCGCDPNNLPTRIYE